MYYIYINPDWWFHCCFIFSGLTLPDPANGLLTPSTLLSGKHSIYSIVLPVTANKHRVEHNPVWWLQTLYSSRNSKRRDDHHILHEIGW